MFVSLVFVVKNRDLSLYVSKGGYSSIMVPCMSKGESDLRVHVVNLT